MQLDAYVWKVGVDLQQLSTFNKKKNSKPLIYLFIGQANTRKLVQPKSRWLHFKYL